MYLPQTTYLYRLHADSITHTQSNVKRVFFENTAREFQCQRALEGQDALMRGCPPEVPVASDAKPGSAAKQVGGKLLGSAWRAHQGGNKQRAVVLGFRALMHMPLEPLVWRSVAALIAKPAKR